MNRFEITIFWSDADHAFVANVPELPGCMAHGDTRESALVQVKQAITLWLKTAHAVGSYPAVAPAPACRP